MGAEKKTMWSSLKQAPFITLQILCFTYHTRPAGPMTKSDSSSVTHAHLPSPLHRQDPAWAILTSLTSWEIPNGDAHMRRASRNPCAPQVQMTISLCFWLNNTPHSAFHRDWGTYKDAEKNCAIPLLILRKRHPLNEFQTHRDPYFKIRSTVVDDNKLSIDPTHTTCQIRCKPAQGMNAYYIDP